MDKKYSLKILNKYLFEIGYEIFRLKDNILIGALEGPLGTPYKNGFFIFEIIFQLYYYWFH